MAGVRKLRELSMRRSSNYYGLPDADDDSRPISPDKQDKRVLSSHRTTEVGCEHGKLMPKSLPPKASSQQTSNSRHESKVESFAASDLDKRSYKSRSKGNSSSSNNSNSRQGSKASQHRPRQTSASTAASPAALTTRLHRSYSSPSRESSSSSIGAIDSYAQLLPPAYIPSSTSSASKRCLPKVAPAHKASATNSPVVSTSFNSLKRQSQETRGRSTNSVNSSRSSSRGITPPPASPISAAGFAAVSHEQRCTPTLISHLLTQCTQNRLYHSGRPDDSYQCQTCSVDEASNQPTTCTTAVTVSASSCNVPNHQHEVQADNLNDVSIAAGDSSHWYTALGTPPSTPAGGVLPAVMTSQANIQAELACIRDLLSSQQWQRQQQQGAVELAGAATAAQDCHVPWSSDDQARQQPPASVALATAAKQGATAFSKAAAVTAGDDLPMAPSLDDADFEEVTRDIAARIIQAHWHRYASGRRSGHQPLAGNIPLPASPEPHQYTRQQQQQQEREQQRVHATTESGLVRDRGVVTHQQICNEISAGSMKHEASPAEREQGLSQPPPQQQDLGVLQQHRQHESASTTPEAAADCSTELVADVVQQLLDQLQLEPDALETLSSNQQLVALLAAAMQRDQQQQQEEAEDMGDGSDAEADESCSTSNAAGEDVLKVLEDVSCDAEDDFTGVIVGSVAGQQQQEQQQLSYSSDLLDDQSAPTSCAAAELPVLRSCSTNSSSQQQARPSSSSGRMSHEQPAPLGRLRRSMESRQLQQLQQYKSSSTAAAMGACTAAPEAQLLHVADSQDDGQHVGTLRQQQQQMQQYQGQQAENVAPSKAASVLTATDDDTHIATQQQQQLQQQLFQAEKQLATEQSDAASLRQAVPMGLNALSASFAAVSTTAAAAAGALDPGGGCNSRSSLGAEKLGNILAYLDAVDAEAEEEAAAATGVPAAISRESSQFSRAPSLGSLPGKYKPLSRPVSRGAPAAAAVAYPGVLNPSASMISSPSKHKHQLGAEALIVNPCSSTSSRPSTGQQQQHQQLGQLTNLLEQHEQQQMVVYAATELQQQQQQHEHIGCDASLSDEHSAAVSVEGFSMVSQGNRSAVLAESVFEGVRNKMNRLKLALTDKEAVVQALQQELHDTRQRQADQLSELAQVHEQELAAAASDAAATVSRHLAFIDRLMADKEQINRQLTEQQAAGKAAEERHAGAIAALKAGWAAELKRQQASWEAGHASRQEAWKAEKTKEIKEQTVKGLEVEVQRLITRHRAELASVHDQAAEQAKVAAEQLKTQHEAQIAALKDRLRQEQDEALERERASSASRLREACERYESQMQSARLRLLADTDSKLEAAAAAVREEKRKGEVALEAAAVAAKQREEQLRQDWNREKEALLHSHARALDQAKTSAQEERSAWRAAVTEKIKRQAMEREEQLKKALIKVRDAEIDLVIQRLEAEHQAAVQAARQQIAAENAATVSSLEERLKEAQRSATRLGDKAKAAATAVAEAEKQRDAAEQDIEQLRHELRLRDQQLAAANASVVAKEAEGRAAAAAAGTAASQALQDLAVDKGQLEAKVSALTQELQQTKQQHEAEMQHVEYRVKGVIAKKDDAIQRLQQQLSAALEQMRGTEAVLAAQQAELYE